MKRRLLGVIEKQGIWELEDKSVIFTGDADIDCDGGPNPFHDPYWQAQTTLHHNGKSINSEVVPGMVVPPLIIKKTVGIVMGCQCEVTYKSKKDGKTRTERGVVFDSGPTKKIGEISPAMAKRLLMNPNPINGGEDEQVVVYKLWPGVPATVEGITYNLQKA